MLPVVYGTGGPPSSRRRRRATIFLGVVSSALGNTRNVASSSSIIRPASTATIMTTALGLLMILLPAAYPDKISIGECSLSSVLYRIARVFRGHETRVRASYGQRQRHVARHRWSNVVQLLQRLWRVVALESTRTCLFNSGWK